MQLRGSGRAHRGLGRTVVSLVALAAVASACAPGSSPAAQAPTATPAAAPTSGASTAPPAAASTAVPAPLAAAPKPAAPAASASAVAAASAAAQPSAAPLRKLRVGLGSTPAPALPNSVLWLAKDLGFYEREGLDVDLVEMQGTPVVIAAMLAGEIDVGNIGADEVLNLVGTKGADLRAIHSPDTRQYFMIVGQSSIGSVQELKGKTYGVARRGSVDESLSRAVMTKLGLDPNGVTFLTIGDPSTRAQTLVAGRVDATTLSLGTWVTIQDQPGVKALVGVDDYFNAAPVVAKVDAATTKVIQQKPEELRRFTAAIMKASRAFADSQQTWVDAMAKRRTDMQRPALEKLWDGFRTSWAANGEMNLQQYQATAEYDYGTEPLKDVPHVDLNAWTDTQFVDSVLKEIGVDKRMDDPGRPIP